MCWPYTLMYGCMDCFAEEKPPAECCVIVAPDAEDPVVGGYNREGSLCPLRYVGPRPSERLTTPMSCPILLASSRHEPATPAFANKAFLGNANNNHGENPFAYGTPHLRFWICSRHRPRYLEELGPSFAGYELARRSEVVEDKRRDIAKGKQRQERWNEMLNVVSGSQLHLNLKRKQDEGVKEEAKTTVGVAATACSLSELIDSYRSQE